MYHILVVDDEQEIAALLELYLKNEGYGVYTCDSARSAMQYIREKEIDLALLDVMLPDGDGFALCRTIRQTYNYPIIMLTAKVEDMDKITGLSIGADDYITKPFNTLEVVARVKAQLRRYKRYNEATREDEEIFDYGGLIVNHATHECTLYGEAIQLTPTEFNILWTLAQNHGKVVSSEELYERVWGERYLDGNNTIMVHIRRLREKLHEPFRDPKIIKTVWGVGYKIEKQP